MAAPNILESYLVRLSMKGPSAAEQREAEKAFSALAEAVALAVPAITAAATAITFATDKIASGLSKLYFEAQKTGTTVRELAAVGYAFEQNGSTLEKFHADFDKFAETVRHLPGLRNQLRDRLGLKPEDFKDDLTLYSATLKKLAAMRAAGNTQSEGAWRKLFGFDEDNILARGRKEFDKFYAEGQKRNEGLEEISVKAVALVRSLNAFGAALEAVGRKAAAALFDKYGIVLDDITKWVNDHSDAIIKAFSTVVDQFVLAWKDIAPIVVPAVHKIAAGMDIVTAALDRLLGSPDGQHGGLHAVRYVLDALAIYVAGKWALKLAGLLGIRQLLLLLPGGAAALAAYEFFNHVPKAEGDDSYGLDHPGWHPEMPKEKTRAEKERDAAGSPISPEAVTAVGGGPPAAFIMHHTGGGGSVEGVRETLRQRGLGVEYVMDREGNIVKTGGPGAKNIMHGWGAGEGLSNENVVGMEVIAKDDKDVTQAQIESAKKFIREKYPKTPVYGHGEVNPGHKEATEGLSIVKAIRAERAEEERKKREAIKPQSLRQLPDLHTKLAALARHYPIRTQMSRTNNIGTRKQVTNIQLASTDPHAAASEIASHMRDIHAGTLRSLDRLT
jgi:hypothetical protein